jgi:hypothetical protein
MRRWSNALVVSAVLFLTVSAVAVGQEPAQEPGQDEAMAPYIAAATPGAEHEWLARMAGEYEVTTKMWMDPSAEPEVNTATAKSEMALGGRYLMDHYEGTFAGMSFQGRGMTGYDNTLHKYVSTWIDNMGTGILSSVGERDDEGRLVMLGEFEDPATGVTMGLKSVTWLTDDGYMMEMFNILPDGTEFRSMELTAKLVE